MVTQIYNKSIFPPLNLRIEADKAQSDVPFRTYSSNLFPTLPTLSNLQSITASGITRRLITAAEKEEVKVECLLMYVVEGDNREDARAFAALVAEKVFDQGSLFSSFRSCVDQG